MDIVKKIINEKIVTIRERHKCYGCGRDFDKGTTMNSASCKINGIMTRKHFCEGCHHTMTIKNIGIDKFCYGDLLRDALSYEKNKLNNSVVRSL